VDLRRGRTRDEEREAIRVPAERAQKCLLPPRPVLRADHPFVFLNRDDRVRSMLFLGRPTDPVGGA
jgi:serine protease inhibitor